MKDIFDFLKELKENNNKEWFDKNRDRYQSAKKIFEEFSELLISEVNKIDKSVGLPEAKKCIFRIFRDVRFSKDKTPYKSNFGCFIAQGGRKSIYPGYYFHYEPGSSFVGGGIYCPPKETLLATRTEIYENPEEFISILNKPSFKKVYSELWQDDKLKTCPKNFPKDFEHVDLLRYKSYTAVTNIEDKELLSDKLVDKILDSFKELKPLNDFINNALKNHS